MATTIETASGMEMSEFDTRLVAFVKANGEAMEHARWLSETALKHFEEHGDTVLCQRFHDALVKDWNRRNAFLLWLKAFSPIDMKDKKLIKDKRANATSFNITEACSEPFWEFSPEKPIEYFSADKPIEMLDALVKRLSKDKTDKNKFQPADEKAEKVVSLLGEMAKQFHSTAMRVMAEPEKKQEAA